MKTVLLFTLMFAVILANNLFCVHMGETHGRVEGCQYAYRDLYTKYGIKHIDEDALKSFCEKQ